MTQQQTAPDSSALLEPGPAARTKPAAESRATVVSGALVLGAGAVSTLALYLIIAHLQSEGRSAAAISMPTMGMTDMGKFWSFPILQASGLTGLFFAFLSVALGLQQSGRRVSRLPLTYRQIDRLHRQISLLVIGLVLIHIVATLFDAMGDSWRTVFVPGGWSSNWPQAVWGYDTGIFGFYLMLLLAPTYYVRRGIGANRWRFAHRFVLVFYILAVWHTLILGADVGHYTWIRPVIWLAQLPLLALFARRLAQPARSGERAPGGWRAGVRHGLVALSTLAAVAIVMVVVSGQSGFIANV
jgi:hypothetical protein